MDSEQWVLLMPSNYPYLSNGQTLLNVEVATERAGFRLSDGRIIRVALKIDGSGEPGLEVSVYTPKGVKP